MTLCLRFSRRYLHVGQLTDRWKKWPPWRLRQINQTTILWWSGQENSILRKHTHLHIGENLRGCGTRRIQIGDIIGSSELQSLKTHINF